LSIWSTTSGGVTRKGTSTPGCGAHAPAARSRTTSPTTVLHFTRDLRGRLVPAPARAGHRAARGIPARTRAQGHAGCRRAAPAAGRGQRLGRGGGALGGHRAAAGLRRAREGHRVLSPL